jgi:hypothetical protein
MKMRYKSSQHLFFVPAARPSNESKSMLEGPTNTEVAVIPADET